MFLLPFYFLLLLFCTSFFLLLFNFSSIWGQTLLIRSNWFCCFHITSTLAAASSFPVATCLLIILAGTGDTGLCVAPLCSTSSSPPGPTTAPPGLPPLPNVVIATDSQWAWETPCWAKTGRKRHWAASAGADKAKMLSWSPLVRKREKHQDHTGFGRSTRSISWPDGMAGRPCLQVLVDLHRIFCFVCPNSAFWINISNTFISTTIRRKRKVKMILGSGWQVQKKMLVALFSTTYSCISALSALLALIVVERDKWSFYILKCAC